jgi:hypothetical protein
LQEIKPLDLGPISQRFVDIFPGKTTVRAGCSSAQREDVRACYNQCTTSCGPQCCVTSADTLVVVCSAYCCINYDTETEEWVPATSSCIPEGSSRPRSGTGSSGSSPDRRTSPTPGGTGSSGASSGGQTTGGGNRQSPASPSTPSGPAGETPKSSSSRFPLRCFGASALVELESGIPKRMDELAVGDRVKVGNNLFSDIFMFTHKLPAIKNNFVVIRTVSGQVITLTPGHFIYLNNDLVDSAAAKVGDIIFLGNGALSTVSAVSQTVEAGLYNPQTLQGDIVVNGIIASTYTTALRPDTAHALLLPLRALYSAFSLLVNGFENCAIQHVVKKYSS